MSKKYIVLTEFADKDDFRKRFKVGDELPATFDEARLANIVKFGYAKVEETNSGNGNNLDGNPVTDIDLTGNVAGIVAQVKVFTDVEKLKKYLETEQASETMRKTVVEAIQKRIANIVKE